MKKAFDPTTRHEKAGLNLLERTLKAMMDSNLMPWPFTGPKMLWAGPNFLCQTKNLFTYCGSHKHFVPDKKMICIQ